MALVTVKMPDGNTVDVNAPDGASDEDILSFAQSNYKTPESISREEGAASPWRGAFSVLQGPTFGFGDEIVGGLNAIKSLWNDKSVGENYRSGRDFARGAAAEEEKNNHWFTGITRAASTGLLAPLAPVRGVQAAAQAPGIATRVLQTAAQGAKYGTIQGMGDSTADNVEDVVMDGVRGGMKGAVIAPALGGGASVVGAVGKRVGTPVLDMAGRASSAGGGWFRDRLAQAGATMAGNQAQAKVAEALARDRAGSGTVFAQGADPTQSIINRLDRIGPRGSIATAGGTATQGLLDTLSVIPGETGQALSRYQRQIQSGRGPAMAQAADNALGTNGAQYASTIEALDATRKTVAKPLYDALDGVSVKVDRDIYSLLQKTKVAHGEASSLYEQQHGIPLDLSKLNVGDDIPFKSLDALKQALWAYTDSLKVAGKGKLAVPADNNRVALVRKLDELSPKDANGNPIYKLARDAYAGPSEMIGAAELGRKAMRGDVMEVAKEMSGFSSSEMDAFRVGALQALREKTGTQAGQTNLLKMWMEPATQERLKTVFGSNYDYRRFARDVAAEEKLNPILRLGTRGSTTANKVMGAGDLDIAPAMDAAGFVTSAAHGNAPGMVTTAARMWNRVQTPEAVRDQMGRILLSQGPQARENLLRMQEFTRRVNAARAVKQQLSGGAAANAAPAGLFQSMLGDPTQ